MLRKARQTYVYLPYLFLVIYAAGAGASEQLKPDATLEQVYVTALRHEQDNQRVPIAVSAITAETLVRGNIANSVELGLVTPGLVVSAYNPAKPQFFIRGVGATGTSAGEENSIGVFADDVYLGRAGALSLDFLDLERVDVLKGPQGTLFGRNAAGGVVHLLSKKPSVERSGFFQADYGRFDRVAVKAAMGGALDKNNESLLARGSVGYAQRDGYVRNLLTGSDNLRDTEDLSARLHLLKKWSDTNEALLSIDYAKSEQIGAASRKASTDQSVLTVAGLIPTPLPNDNIFETTLASDAPTQREISGVSLKLNQRTSFGEFVSITALRKNQNNLFEDISGVGLLLLGQDEEAQHITQELRLSSTENDTLNWTLGAYFLDERVERVDEVNLVPISDFFNLNPFVSVPDQQVFYDQDSDSSSHAIYGHLGYALSDEFDLRIGGRYTWDEKEMRLETRGFDALGFGLLDAGTFSGRANDSFDEFTGHISLSYQASKNLLSYLSFSQGYKAGGFDGLSTSLESFLQNFTPEKADSFEWGVKSEWFDNKLRLNTAVFYTRYKDLQVFQVRNTGTQFISNAASATIQGAEIEVFAKPTNSLQVNAGCAFLDNEYDSFISPVDDNFDGFPDDLSGNRLTRSPETSCNVGVNYQPEVGGDRPLAVFLQYGWTDDFYITPQNRTLDRIESYGVLNVSVSYDITSAFEMTVYAKNATDEEYKLHAFDADPFIRNNLQSSVYADPRTWGVRLHYKL